MLKFAKFPLEERISYFEEVANRRNLRQLIVEKDFWVSFILRLLFETQALANIFILKGGTSLSKIFNIIKRFSEDIDLSVDPDWLGFSGENHPDKAPSNRQFIMRCKELEKACITAVKERVHPTLKAAIEEILGPPDASKSHLSFDLDQRTESPVLFFHYPTNDSDTQGYIHPQVKLEIGSLTDQTPFNIHSAKSWVAEEFPDIFEEPMFNVISLEPERTFWEKATILHAEYHRPSEKPMRNRLSRDIYDLCLMSKHEAGKRALSDFDLMNRVVQYKKRYFRSSWANYDTAIPGDFRLAPAQERLSELKADYRQMQEMFFEPPPDFDELIKQLYKIEKIINGK
jgi:hypothetical protein